MFPKDFRFTLKSKYDELVLTLPPEGWKEYGNSWHFNDDVFGYSRRVSVPMRFVKEGANFLRRIKSNEGVNGYCEFKVERLDRNTLTYFVDYIGAVDFSNTTNNRLFFEAPITDKGIAPILNAYGGTKYEIDIDSDRAVDIRTAEGMTFIEFAKYFLTGVHGIDVKHENTQFHTNTYTANDGKEYTVTYDYNNLVLDMMIDDKTISIKSPKFIFKDRVHYDIAYPGFPNPPAPEQEFLYKDKNIDGDSIHIMTCDIDISLSHNNNKGNQNYTPFTFDSVEISFEIVEFINGNINKRYESQQKKIITAQEINDPYIFTDSIKASIQFPMTNSISEYQLRYKTKRNGGLDNYRDDIKFGLTGEVSFEYNGTLQTPVFSFKALPLFDFINEVTKKCCKVNNDIVTFLLDNNLRDNYFITSADAIRGIAGAKGIMSWKDMYKSIEAMFFVAMQVRNNGIEIAPKDWIFEKNTILLDVGEVKDLEFSVPEDWIFNKFKIGYENKTYEEQNGREEFNTGLEFESPVTTISNSKDIISKIRADSFGIQDIRWKFGQNKTKDSSSDNDMFIVCAQKFQNRYVVDNTPSINVSRKGAFNAQLSPKRCMMRWYPYLASIYDKMVNDYVKYVSSDKIDAQLVSSIFDDMVVEKDDVRIGDMREMLFMPLIAEFKTGIRKNVTQLIGESPRGYIEFKYNGRTLRGFPIEMPQDSITRGQQQWKVMMHPETEINIEDIIF